MTVVGVAVVLVVVTAFVNVFIDGIIVLHLPEFSKDGDLFLLLDSGLYEVFEIPILQGITQLIFYSLCYC